MSAQYPEPRNVECIPGDPKPSGVLRGRHDRGRKRRIVRIQDLHYRALMYPNAFVQGGASSKSNARSLLTGTRVHVSF